MTLPNLSPAQPSVARRVFDAMKRYLRQRPGLEAPPRRQNRTVKWKAS